MQLRRAPVKKPTGLSFEVADLLLAQAWADHHELRMEVELDFSAAGDEYEEMISLFARSTGFRRWMIWRSRDGMVVQPVVGRAAKFTALADALAMMIPARE